MKATFKVSELIFRIPVILIGVYVCVYWAFWGELKHGLIFWCGAWFWESVLFILHRARIMNVLKYWN